MILIDKEKLMNHVKGFLGIKSPSRVFMEKLDIEWDDVENASTVKAIPIDFLIKTQEEYCKRYGEVYKSVVLNLVEDWRKENE